MIADLDVVHDGLPSLGRLSCFGNRHHMTAVASMLHDNGSTRRLCTSILTTNAIREVAAHMEPPHATRSRSRQQHRPYLSAELDYTRQRAATALHDVANWLDGADMVDLMTRAEGWARKRPALFLGGAFAIGLIAARVYKGTSYLAAEPFEGDDRSAGESTDFRKRPETDGRNEVPFYPEADLPSRGAGIQERPR